ncbi:MAG: LysR family transcriptional regulator [bacterium]|nr:LysR family transcriptional regulator [bacterium]
MKKKPSLRSLEAFHAVVTLGSIAAAAKHLFITEPAISHLLRRLENTTDLTLFGKKGRRLELTQDGRLFFDETGTAMSVLTRLDSVADDIRSAKHGHIQLVAIPVAADYLLPEILCLFSKSHPEIELNVNVAEGHRALNMLERGNADLAIVMHDGARDYQSHAQMSSHAVLIGPNSRFGTGGNDLDLANLSSEKFIALTAGSPFRYVLDQYISQQRLTFTRTLEVETQSLIVKLVSMSFGISFVDAITVKESQQIAVKKLNPPLCWTFHLLSPANVKLSTAGEVFCKFVKASWD